MVNHQETWGAVLFTKRFLLGTRRRMPTYLGQKRITCSPGRQHFWIAWMIFVTLTSRAEMGVQMIQKIARTISFSPWAQVGMEASAVRLRCFIVNEFISTDDCAGHDHHHHHHHHHRHHHQPLHNQPSWWNKKRPSLANPAAAAPLLTRESTTLLAFSSHSLHCNGI